MGLLENAREKIVLYRLDYRQYLLHETLPGGVGVDRWP